MQLGYAFASLFMPDFVEIDGAVILAEHFEESSFRRWQAHFKGDPRAVERMMNHTHVDDLFLNGQGDLLLPDVVSRRVGEALQATWTTALHAAFPDRSFVVTYEPEDDTGGEVSFSRA